MKAKDQDRVIVVGAGPVGSVLALALAQRDIPVLLLESAAAVNHDPRAATTHPATLEMLDRIGLAGVVTERGLVARKFQFWDRVGDRMITEFDHGILAKETAFPFVVQCEQHKLAEEAIERLRALPHAEVRFSTEFVGLEQDEHGVTASLRSAAGDENVKAAFLVGADGGRSTVRHALDIVFEGYTHPERFLVMTTPFDFASERPVCFRNYFSDPDEWANLFKVSGDDYKGLWRVVVPTRLDETDEEALAEATVQGRLHKFFPRGEPYKVVHRNIYRVHQRVAQTFAKGRVFLAGDSAHVNNPIGGLGMNFGLHDAFDLAGLLPDYFDGRTGLDALEIYDKRRRPLNVEFVQQQTIANKKRLEEKDPEKREAGFRLLAETSADPVRHREFLMRTSLLASVRAAAKAA